MVYQIIQFITLLYYKQSYAHHSLFPKATNSSFTTLIFYVGDIVLVRNLITIIDQIKHFLCSHFQIKDLCKLKYFMAKRLLTLLLVSLYAIANIAYS